MVVKSTSASCMHALKLIVSEYRHASEHKLLMHEDCLVLNAVAIYM